MQFLRAEEKDLPRIARLVNSAYRGDYSKHGWTTEADLLDGQRTDVESLSSMMTEKSFFYIAFEEEKMVGTVHLKKLADGIYYFGMLTVEPKLQGRGIGKFLIEEVENLTLKLKGKELRLTVIDQRSELISFYERRGYKATGHVEAFPENDPKFGIPKTKLRLLEYSKPISADTSSP